MIILREGHLQRHALTGFGADQPFFETGDHAPLPDLQVDAFGLASIEEFTVDGECPGYLSDENDHIAIQLNLSLVSEDKGSEEWGYRTIFEGHAIDVLLDLEDGIFYRLGVTPGLNTSFRLGTAEGLYECTIGPTELSCEATLSLF